MAKEDQNLFGNISPSSVHSDDDDDQDQDQDIARAGAGKSASRQKRRKARRACLACQRAHLTCGDERPCQRCVKRGLQHNCHDGVRKKAKYLHDAPAEALDPVTITNVVKDTAPISSIKEPGHHPENDMGRPNTVVSRGTRVVSPHHIKPIGSQDQSFQHQTLGTDLDSQRQSSTTTSLDQSYFSSGDQSLFNFDLASMNFGNHYGALEFGMLGHLSSGAHEDSRHRTSSTTYEIVNPTWNDASKYGMNLMNPLTDWQTNPGEQGLQMNTWSQGLDHDPLFQRQNGEPYAYAIEAVSSDALDVSPDSIGLPDKATSPERKFTDLPTFPNLRRLNPGRTYSYHATSPASNSSQPRQTEPSEAIARKLGSLHAAVRRRRRDPSTIYSSVTRPYPYTSGFHALTAYLQRRFSSQKRLAIAQALASIRPSFISCTRTLIDDDLVFMEKCFQRQLVEYEDFIGACGTPTIVCRRTGEVAYAGKEFSLLLGWSIDILLGKAPNLNVNGYSPSGTMTAASSHTGGNTPRGLDDVGSSTDALQPARPQAVFLAELLDDDSVVQFYEDFAKLAFADSKGSAWRACKLLKYRTKDDKMLLLDSSKVSMNDGINLRNDTQAGPKKDHIAKQAGRAVAAAQRHRSKNTVDCMYCWTVRRDVFDIPMMIVLNFLPVI